MWHLRALAIRKGEGEGGQGGGGQMPGILKLTIEIMFNASKMTCGLTIKQNVITVSLHIKYMWVNTSLSLY